MFELKKIGVVIVNYHTDEETIKATEMYLNCSSVDEIVIVNNDCEKSEFIDRAFCSNGKVHILYFRENLGYSKGNNKGIEYLISQKIDYIIISNSDVLIDNNAIESTIDKLVNNPDFSAMAPRMIRIDGTPEPFRYTELGLRRLLVTLFIKNLDLKQQNKIKHIGDIVEQKYLPGSFFMVSADAMQKVGMFDNNIFLYGEEEILGQRFLQADLKEGVLTDCFFIHNHNYMDESVKKKVHQMKLTNKSERYLFKQYYGYNDIQMVIVYILENVYLVTRIPVWAIRKLTLKR